MIKPLRNYVIIRLEKNSETTKSGIILPSDTEKEKKDTGEVVAVGDGVELVKVGEKVIFRKWGGEEIEQDGEKLTIIESENLLAVIEEYEP